MRIVLVVYDGVLDDECEAFRSVLGLLDGVELITCGAHEGRYSGPGGNQSVDRTFDRVDHAEVVIVPGGLGCERAADDVELRTFLQRMERRSRYVIASSTGSVVLAAAGLLHGEPAATHWLAGDLLRRYGSDAESRRLVVRGNVITCEGRISAVDAAFAVVERVAGSAEVERIRTTLLARGQPLLRAPRWWETVFERTLGRRTLRRPSEQRSPAERPAEPPVTPLSVMVELVDDEDLVRAMKRRADRERRRRGGPQTG
jgi:putative intracellular protease/amidase